MQAGRVPSGGWRGPGQGLNSHDSPCTFLLDPAHPPNPMRQPARVEEALQTLATDLDQALAEASDGRYASSSEMFAAVLNVEHIQVAPPPPCDLPLTICFPTQLLLTLTRGLCVFCFVTVCVLKGDRDCGLRRGFQGSWRQPLLAEATRCIV